MNQNQLSILMITGRIIQFRIWLILFVIILAAILMPSQFRKGRISDELLFAIPIGSLLLSYSFSLFLKAIPLRERLIIPLILLPFVYPFITVLIEEKLLFAILGEDYSVHGTWQTFFVNLLYYLSLTLTTLGLTKVYATLFPYE